MRLTRKNSFNTFVAALLVLSSCASETSTFAGDLTPKVGTCDAASRAVLIRRGRYLQFTPKQGVLILSGQETSDGALSAVLDTRGADRKPYHLAFTGTVSGSTLTGEYVTPHCRYSVLLTRTE